MLTPEEIKKIALRFALEKSEGDAYDPFEKEYAAEVLQWLSERFCIVEKSKINALQGEIFKEIMDAHDADDWQSVAHYILDIMPRSFTFIFGTELFNEEKI